MSLGKYLGLLGWLGGAGMMGQRGGMFGGQPFGMYGGGGY